MRRAHGRRRPRAAAGCVPRSRRRSVGAQIRERREELVQQVAVRGVQLEQAEAGGERAPRGRANASTTSADLGARQLARHLPAVVEGQGARARPPASRLARRAPAGRRARARRWTPCARRARSGCRAPRRARRGTPRSARKASTWRSDQMPESSGLMRPSGTTALASTITAPAPPIARAPRCTRCHSVGTPSCDEYWHIGETQARLRNPTSRRLMGVCRSDMPGVRSRPAARAGRRSRCRGCARSARGRPGSTRCRRAGARCR